jgi:predicted Zn-dependent protease
VKKKRKQKPQKKNQKKKAKKPVQKTQSVPRKILSEIEDLFDQEAWQEAYTALLMLEIEYPKAPEVYALMTMLGEQVQDFSLLTKGAYHWARLAPYHPDIVATWAQVAMANSYLGHARRANQQLLLHWPDHEHAEAAKEQLAEIDSAWDEFITDMQFKQASNPNQFMCWFEDAQFALEEERWEDAFRCTRNILSKLPSHPPSKHMSALAQFHRGQIDAALAIGTELLEEEEQPSITTMAMMVQILSLLERHDEAKQLVHDIRERGKDDESDWHRTMDACAYVYDAEGILEAVEEVQEWLEESEEEQGWGDLEAADQMALLAGVAHVWNGDQEQGKVWFKRVLQVDPNDQMAQENLEQLDLPAHDQFKAWNHHLFHFVPMSIAKELLMLLQSSQEDDSERNKRNLDTLLSNYSFWPFIFRKLLIDAGPQSAQLALALLITTDRKEFWDIAEEIAFQPEGPFDIREELLVLLKEKGSLTPGKAYPFWEIGEETQWLYLPYEIESPTDIDESYRASLETLREQLEAQEWDKVEQGIKDLRNNHPDRPESMRFEAMLAEARNDQETAHSLCQTWLESHPNDVWAHSKLALDAIGQGDADKAKEHLLICEQQQTCDRTSLRLFCEAEIAFWQHQSNEECASQWLNFSASHFKDSDAMAKAKKKKNSWSKVKRLFRK